MWATDMGAHSQIYSLINLMASTHTLMILMMYDIDSDIDFKSEDFLLMMQSSAQENMMIEN